MERAALTIFVKANVRSANNDNDDPSIENNNFADQRFRSIVKLN